MWLWNSLVSTKTDLKNLIYDSRNEKEERGIEQMILMMLTIRQMTTLRVKYDKEKVIRNEVDNKLNL